MWFWPLAFSRPPRKLDEPAQNPRIALVIGNATYRDAALATTANDAGLVAQTLQAAGFDVVGARDLDGQSLRTAFRDFLDKASAAGPDMQAFVYLAGRGVQYDGDNYFVPVDAQINRDADVPIDALRISDFAHALAQTPGKARIIVLDAARANPYASQGSPLAPGLALVDPEPGELIAFNAAPGTLAGDEQGPYGVYGKTLAGAMRQGGVDVVEVFDQTRVTVNQQTQGALLPWSASKLTEPYYIFERAADAPPPAVAAPGSNPSIAGLPAEAAYTAALQQDTISGYEEYLSHFPDSAQTPRVRAILAALREAYFWRRSVNANTAHAYWTYLRRYPKGPHVADARRRLAMISAAYEPPPDFQPMTYQDLPPPPQDEGFYEEQPVYAFDAFGPPPLPPPPEYYQQYYYVEDDDWRDLPPPPPPVDVGFLPVLAIGIPLVVGAVGFQHYEHYHRDGIAPAGLPRFRPPPPAPPPLPRNVNPVQPPAPVTVAAAPAANRQSSNRCRRLAPAGRGQAGGHRLGRRSGQTSGAPRLRDGKSGGKRRCHCSGPGAKAASGCAGGGQAARTPRAGCGPDAPVPPPAGKRCETCGTTLPGGKPLPIPPAAVAAPTRQRRRAVRRCRLRWRRRRPRLRSTTPHPFLVESRCRWPRRQTIGPCRRAGRNETRGESAASAAGDTAIAGGKPFPAPTASPTATKALTTPGRLFRPATGSDAQCRRSAAGRGAARFGSDRLSFTRLRQPRLAALPSASAPRPAPAPMRVPRPEFLIAGGPPPPAPAPPPPVVHAPPPPPAVCAACASSAATRGSSSAAGRAPASVRQAWAAALSEVAFARSFCLGCRRGGLCKVIARRARVSDGNRHPICRWRSSADRSRRQSRQVPAFGGCGG